MSVNIPSFEEWLKLRCEDAAGQPAAPRKGSKVSGHTDDKPSGVRCHTDDLSDDYPHHVAQNGECDYFKCKSKKGKKVADVAGGS